MNSLLLLQAYLQFLFLNCAVLVLPYEMISVVLVDAFVSFLSLAFPAIK